MIYLQKNLRFLLKQNQASYREVSKESGVSIKVISAIINNSNLHVTLNSVVKLANYFKLLKQNQASYREVSKESGVSIKVISAIINNSNLHVTLNSVVKLANYFKVTLDDFVMKDIEQKHLKFY